MCVSGRALLAVQCLLVCAVSVVSSLLGCVSHRLRGVDDLLHYHAMNKIFFFLSGGEAHLEARGAQCAQQRQHGEGGGRPGRQTVARARPARARPWLYASEL